jgi:hypothetical protein
VDGQTCYVRVRAFNGTQWSNWQADQFHLNSVPSAPSGLTPSDLMGVTSATPALTHVNASDNESDPLTYDYEVFEDSLLTILVAQADNQPQGSGSSSWTVSPSLTDETVYYWRTRAFDGYEDGAWSPAASFWVNSNNSAPAAFNLLTPADSLLVSDPLPTFTWSASSDADLYDTVSYSFILGVDTTTGLSDTVFTAVDSLAMGTEYLWKVLAVDKFGGVTQSTETFLLSTLTPGDANGDGVTNVGDAVFLINYVFRDGPPPDPFKAGDANSDCAVNVGDAVFLINYIFRDGPAPEPGCA